MWMRTWDLEWKFRLRWSGGKIFRFWEDRKRKLDFSEEKKSDLFKWIPCTKRRKGVAKLKCEYTKVYVGEFCFIDVFFFNLKVMRTSVWVWMPQKIKKVTSKLVVMWCDMQHAQRTFYEVTQNLDTIGQRRSRPIQVSPYHNFVKTSWTHTQKSIVWNCDLNATCEMHKSLKELFASSDTHRG